MSNIIKSAVFDVEIVRKNILLVDNEKGFVDFESILKELSSTLDDIDSVNHRILDKNSKDKETSIWFDSFDNINIFSKEIIFDDTICFLLAKDMNFQLVEDKENHCIENFSSTLNLKPKIPSHCVFIKSKNILLMEETTNSPTISTLHRGVVGNTRSIQKDDIDFKAQYRENIIERLEQFVDNIKSIEMTDINIEKYLKESEDTDGYLHNFLHNPETKLNAKLSIESSDWRTKAVKFFTATFNNRVSKELNNIKISFKDDKQKDDILALYNNLVYLKVEKEIYHEYISGLQEMERIEYSKNIYKTMIEAYNEDENS